MALEGVFIDPDELEKLRITMDSDVELLDAAISDMEQLIKDLRQHWHGDVNHRKFRSSFNRGLAELKAESSDFKGFIGSVEQATKLYRDMESELDDCLNTGYWAGE